jgi:hypothetical protein
MHPDVYTKRRRVGNTAAKREFEVLKAQYSQKLENIVQHAKDGVETTRRAPLKLLYGFYRRAYRCGLKAGGRAVTSSGPLLTREDERWVKTAVNEEARYWRKFMADVLSGAGRLSYDRRKEMYVKTLTSLYETGKIQALPDQVLLYWVIDSHIENCNDCKFMAENGPYTKQNIPTVPRSGNTQCLSNCGCRIMTRHVNSIEYTRARAKMPTRSELMARLKRSQR